MKKMAKMLDSLNSIIAVRLTIVVGSIWAFYAFLLYGLLPFIWPASEATVLYWSNFMQLLFLPLITVGSNVLGRASARRAQKDHLALMEELRILKEIQSDLKEILHEALK